MPPFARRLGRRAHLSSVPREPVGRLDRGASEPRLDAQLLAALLDGRLEPRARDALLVRLGAPRGAFGANDAFGALDALVDAAAVLDALERDGSIPRRH